MAHLGWGASEMSARARSKEFDGHHRSEASDRGGQTGRAFVNSLVDRGAVGRVYEDVKEKILSGELGFKERIDVEALARQHRLSATPVRQALAYLAFERLLIAHPSRGFEVKLWSERGLQDLYEWRAMLANMAVDGAWGADEVDVPLASADHLLTTTHLFSALHRDGNDELGAAAANADDRLRAARMAEPMALDGCERELEEFVAVLREGERRSLRLFLDRYHARRIEAAAKIRMLAALRSFPGGED